jgi:hypothetical protein
LLTLQTAQPRTAFRLFSTPIARGYPKRIPLTHSRTPPPERRPVERGEDSSRRGGTSSNRPRTQRDAGGGGNLRSARRSAWFLEERGERVRQRNVDEGP